MISLLVAVAYISVISTNKTKNIIHLNVYLNYWTDEIQSQKWFEMIK